MNSLVLENLTFALTPRKRLCGLLGKRTFGGVLVLVPCRDVHTFGMRMRIDVAFLDGSGLVVRSDCDVGPMRRLACSSAIAVIERQADDASYWPSAGDRLHVGFIGSAETVEMSRKEGKADETVSSL